MAALYERMSCFLSGIVEFYFFWLRKQVQQWQLFIVRCDIRDNTVVLRELWKPLFCGCFKAKCM